MTILSKIFHKPATPEIPMRVQADIAERQFASEKIISWLQMSLVIIFTTLYLLAPEYENGLVMARYAVPLALLGNFCFICVRIFLAHKKKLPWWFLTLSCFLDIALLYWIIATFAHQYAQPPSFVLKSPTLLYVFIYIALRALRFDHIYVLMTGLFAAVGWFLVVDWAVTTEGMDVITRNYVEYITSNRILIGAEFDKIIAILIVTIILAVASVRSRNLLFKAVQDNLARSDMSKFFTDDVANKIVEGGDSLAPGEGERLTVAVLNVDLRGFTKLSAQMEASDLMKLLSEYQGRVVPIIERHGGNIDKFMGDGIMATFGTGADRDEFAKQAILCIPEILESVADMQALDAPLRIGAALATGSLIYGVIGSKDRLEYTSIGEPVNLSAKLEKYNSDNGTKAVCDRATLELAMEQGLRGDFPHTPRPDSPVTGVAKPMEVIVLAE